MRLSLSVKLFAFGFLGIIFISVGSVFASGISLPYSNVDQKSMVVTANDLKPDACAGIYLTYIVSGSGIITGTAGNDLILGSAAADTIDALGGDDCIVSGNGNDMIEGGVGTDVCFATSGQDTATNCEVVP